MGVRVTRSKDGYADCTDISKWGFGLQGAEDGMLTARISLNGSSGNKELTQYQIKLSPGFLLQGYVPVAYFISSTGPTDLYFTLNPFPTVSAGNGMVGEAKVSCIFWHQGVQLRLAYSWARPAVLAAGV
ncbi:MAG: hypothetical protein AB2556_11880, partial [Candidatus Thiodiazotropha sp.]